MRMSASITVNEPVDAVWAFITNVENYSKWAPGAIEPRQTSEGPFGQGSTFSLKYKFRGKLYDVSGKVTAFTPQNHMALQNRGGPFPMEEYYYLESMGNGSRLKHDLNVHPTSMVLKAVFLLLRPLMKLMLKREMQKELRSLKSHLESARS